MRRRSHALAAAIVVLSLITAGAVGAPRSPKRVATVTVSKVGGLGQIEVHGKLAAVNQRDEGIVALLDLSNPARPKVVGRFDAAEEGGHISSGSAPLDGDLAFSADGRYLFYARQTTDYSEEGLHVLDVSNPTDPNEVFYQPQGGMLRVAYYHDGSSQWVVTLDAIAGLVVSRFIPETGAVAPVHVDPLPATKVGGPASAGVVIDPNDPLAERPLMFVTTGRTGLQVFDLSDPAAPQELGSWSEVGLADLEVVTSKKRRLVYAASEYWFDRTANQVRPEIVVLDATDPAAIKRVATLSLGVEPAAETRVQGIDMIGSRLYAAHSGEGLVVFDVRRRKVLGRFKDPGPMNDAAAAPGAPYAIDVEATGRRLLVSDGATGRITVLRP
jgi:hypothetical protein